ncbi:phage integrase SAM-like domain-containing protein [Flavobacteriales bacterium]|nr:phage integrase SAM-like domain-containing protein [Flavobacteriales bacterium]
MLNNLNNICYMHVNFYKRPQIQVNNTHLKMENATLFLEYLSEFIANSATRRVKGYGNVGLAHNTIRTYKSLYRITKEYELEKSQQLFLAGIDKKMAVSFTQFLKIEKQYSDNYCGQLLKLLKIILRDAQKSGFEIHPYSNYIESFKQKSSDRIIHFLNPDEIKVLKRLERIPSELEDSYKWLLIGLSIGQRVSDLLSLNASNIRKANNGLYIDIIQKKTKKAVTIGVADLLVIDLLESEFPKVLSQEAFNKHIKMICKIAGIDEVVRGFKNNPKTRRKEVLSAPKYEFVTSHIMRRSFATNYYGKIETPLLMNITGHTKESTFLTYIGTHQNKDALADLFMQKAGVIW